MKEALQTLHIVFLFYRNTLHNKIFQTLINVCIHLCKQTLQQYFTQKMYTFLHSPFPLLAFLRESLRPVKEFPSRTLQGISM